jgi:hypothetical protein
LQGLDHFNVSLTDKGSNNFTVDLKKTPSLSFTSAAGTLNDRFILNVTMAPTGIEDPVAKANSFNIYTVTNFINIRLLADEWDGKKGTVIVSDMTGRSVQYIRNAEFTRNSIIQIPAAGLKGIYFVEG